MVYFSSIWFWNLFGSVDLLIISLLNVRILIFNCIWLWFLAIPDRRLLILRLRFSLNRSFFINLFDRDIYILLLRGVVWMWKRPLICPLIWSLVIYFSILVGILCNLFWNIWLLHIILVFFLFRSVFSLIIWSYWILILCGRTIVSCSLWIFCIYLRTIGL